MKSQVVRTIALFVLLLFSVSAAQAAAVVWKIKGIPNSVYLAGSCHALRASDYPLPAVYEKAYAEAAVLAFETDLDDLQKPLNQQLLMKKGVYPFEDGLKKHLKPESYAKLTDYCSKNGISPAMANRFRPWMLSMVLLLREFQKAGISAEDGMDVYFNRKAAADGKKRIGLVPVAEHIELFSDFDEALDESIVGEMFDELSKVIPEMKDLLQAWKTGDTARLDELFNRQLRLEYPVLYQKLLMDRNKKWIPTIKNLVNSGQNVMIIVGCAHLVGDNSVIELLRKEGYELEQE